MPTDSAKLTADGPKSKNRRNRTNVRTRWAGDKSTCSPTERNFDFISRFHNVAGGMNRQSLEVGYQERKEQGYVGLGHVEDMFGDHRPGHEKKSGKHRPGRKKESGEHRPHQKPEYCSSKP